MVLPAQKIVPGVPGVPGSKEVSDAIFSPDAIPNGEGSPLTPESISTIGNSQPQTNDSFNTSTIASDVKDNPQPGKIIDKASKSKEKITTLSTLDKLTLEADEEENEFIPKVEEAHNHTANDKLS